MYAFVYSINEIIHELTNKGTSLMVKGIKEAN